MKQQMNKPELVLTQEEKKENENTFPTTNICRTSHVKSHYIGYHVIS